MNDRVASGDRLWDQAPCGLLVTDDDGTVLAANESVLQTLGRTRDDVVGRLRLVDLLSGGSRMYHETHLVPMLRMQGDVTGLALDLRSGDGARVPVLLSARRDRTLGGVPETHVVIFDAQERRNYERELLRAKQRSETSEARAVALSRTLQATLIPPLPPSISGLDVVTVYRPAGSGDEVGGDFYDIFQAAPAEWVVAIGDVEGKGVEAAVVTSLARHMLHVSAARASGPRQTLLTLNEILRGADTTRLLTGVVIRLKERAGRWQMTCAAAGHTPPMLLRPGRPPRDVGGSGTLLGAVAHPPIVETTETLEHGDIVVLTTDGIQEAQQPHTRRFYGHERMTRLAETHRGSVHEIVHELVADVLAFSEGNTRDDIAVVAFEVRAPFDDDPTSGLVSAASLAKP